MYRNYDSKTSGYGYKPVDSVKEAIRRILWSIKEDNYLNLGSKKVID